MGWRQKSQMNSVKCQHIKPKLSTWLCTIKGKGEYMLVCDLTVE